MRHRNSQRMQGQRIGRKVLLDLIDVRPSLIPSSAAPLTEEATIEEATDEEESTVPSKKKKKKPKKKKRLASITSADQVPLSSAPAPAFPVPPEIKSPPVTSTIGKAKKAPASLVSNARPATQAISAAALPTFETATTKVESARAYLSSLEPQKAKSKTRSDQASIFSKDDESKAASGGIGSSIMSKLGFGKKKPIMEPKEQRMAQKSWFSRLSTRAAASMHHLLNTSSDVKQGKGGMKWDDFVKVRIIIVSTRSKILIILKSKAYGGDGLSM